jgi:PEP-CTERM motif
LTKQLAVLAIGAFIVMLVPQAKANTTFSTNCAETSTADANAGNCATASHTFVDGTLSFLVTGQFNQDFSTFNPITGAAAGMVNDLWWGSYINDDLGLSSLTCSEAGGANSNPCNGLGATDAGMTANTPLQGDGMMAGDSLLFNISGGSVAVTSLQVQFAGYNSVLCSVGGCPAGNDAHADAFTVYVHYVGDAPGTTEAFSGAAATSAGGLLIFSSLGGINLAKTIDIFAIQQTDGATLITGINDAITSAPEPATIGLIGLGMLALGLRRRK